MATLTFNETTYDFQFDKAIHTDTDYRERHKILINGEDTNKFLMVSTEKIDGKTVESPLRQRYDILVPSTKKFSNPGVYTTPYTQYYDAGLPFEIVTSIIKFLNKKY